MRKLSLVIAGILGAGTPLISQAATLGEARVQSYLSERLDVRVPLARSSDEPLDEITVKLAPPSFYREAGVPLENITGNLTFRIESEGDREYVLIGSKRPIRDPILSILLEVDSPQGRMIREFNLLLDPPSTDSPEDSRSGEASSSAERPATDSPAEPASASSAWQRVDPATDVALDESREVRRGDTLYDIARDYVSDADDVRPMMQAIIDANPDAFVDGNGNALMAGVELKVPVSEDARAETTGERGDEGEGKAAKDQSEAGTEERPALELIEPEEEDQGDESSPPAPTELGGFGDLSRDEPLAAIGESAGDELDASDEREAALDREEMESIRAENETLTEQLGDLKDQIDSVKVAVDERDSEIARLEDVVEQSRAELEQAEKAADSFWVEWGKYLTGALGLVILALLIALGLRRGRRDDEPAVPMPETADTADRRTFENEPQVESGPSASATAVGSAAAIGAAASANAAMAEPDEKSSTGGDAMNPEMALEEARVLESFNLTHQAVELLQDSLTEHPGHEGLQAALNRLKGLEDAGQGSVHGAAPSVAEDDIPTEGPRDSTGFNEDTDTSESTGEISSTADVTESTESDRRPGEALESPAPENWDDDLDDMLATPESEPATRPAEDEHTMDLDDSFALETPTSDEGERRDQADEGLDLPENVTPPASVESHEARDAEPEPEPLDLDLSGYDTSGSPEEPTETRGEESGLDLDLGEPASSQVQEAEEREVPEEAEPIGESEDMSTDSETDTDTRVGLAEAFLDVGDRESFDMIEAELREEGATAALERLEELKKRFPD